MFLATTSPQSTVLSTRIFSHAPGAHSQSCHCSSGNSHPHPRQQYEMSKKHTEPFHLTIPVARTRRPPGRKGCRAQLMRVRGLGPITKWVENPLHRTIQQAPRRAGSRHCQKRRSVARWRSFVVQRPNNGQTTFQKISEELGIPWEKDVPFTREVPFAGYRFPLTRKKRYLDIIFCWGNIHGKSKNSKESSYMRAKWSQPAELTSPAWKSSWPSSITVLSCCIPNLARSLLVEAKITTTTPHCPRHLGVFRC